MSTWPYGRLENDMHALVVSRVKEAVNSVSQLAETPEQYAMILIAAFSFLAGAAGGAIAATNEDIGDHDPLNVAIGILEAIRDGKGNAP